MAELERRLGRLEGMQREALPEAPEWSWQELLQHGEGDDTGEGRMFTVLQEVFHQALSELGEDEAEEMTWSVFMDLDYWLEHGKWGPLFDDDPEGLRRYILLARARLGGGQIVPDAS
ncbi:MAG: hypothetical protein ABSB57_02430 [Dehalococcoidia bacterium]